MRKSEESKTNRGGPQASRPRRGLRARAEAVLRSGSRGKRRAPQGDARSVIQELETQQVELELQNEDLRDSQVALARSNDRLTDLYERAPAGYLTLDASGTVIDANLRVAAMLGVPRPELRRGKLQRFIEREHQDALYLHLQAVFASNESQTCELVFKSGDRAKLIALVESVAFEDPDAGRLLCRAAVIDVTERRQAEALRAAINAINLHVHSTLNQDEIMQGALEKAALALGCDTAALSLRRGKRWVVAHVMGIPKTTVGREMSDVEEPHAVLAIESRQPIAISDAKSDGRVNRRHMQKWGILSVLVVPLVVRDEAIGVLFFNYQKAPVVFSEAHVDFGVKLAASLSLALENARLVVTLKGEVQERALRERRIVRLTRLYAVLSRVNEAIVRMRVQEALFAEVCQIVADIGEFPLVWIGQCEDGAVKVAASWGSAVGYLQQMRDEGRSRLCDGPDAAALRQGQPVIDRDFDALASAARYAFTATAAFPLLQDGRVVGTLNLCACEPDAFDADDVQLLRALAADLSYALGALRQEQLRTEAERALNAAERRMSLVVDSIADGFYVLDRDLRFTHLNDAALRHFHKTREEMLGRGLLEVFPAVAGTIFESQYRKALESGQPAHIETPSVVTDRTVEIHAYPGSDSLTVLFHDVTERSDLQRALVRSEELYRALARNLPDAAVWVVGPDLRCLVVEGALVPSLGWTREALEGQRLADVLDEPSLSAVEEPFRRALDGQAASYETTHGGRAFWTRYVPLRDGLRHVIGAMALSLDVTERQRMEDQLRRLNEGLELLVEERTTALRELVARLKDEVTRRGEVEEELRAAKDGLEQRAAQLHALALELTWAEERERRRVAQILHDDLQQLLLAAGMHVKALDRPMEPEERARALKDASAVLDEAFQSSRSLSHDLSPPIIKSEELRPAFEWLAERVKHRHGLKVKVTVQPRLRVPSERVGSLVFRAVQELLFNAVKHAAAPDAVVSAAREGEQLRVTVADSGRGFNVAALDAGIGAGLGLTSIRERVGLLGGTVKVESAPGQGCRVTILLPVAQLDASPPKALPVAKTVSGASTRPTAERRQTVRRRAQEDTVGVLVVDDHDVLRQGLVALLRDERDLRVVGEASNGAEAVELAGRLMPDVVVMDVTMPVMDGVEATRQIHQRYPGMSVIGLSVLADSEAGARMRTAGASAFLSKGAPSQSLLQTIRGASRKPAQ